MENHIRSTVKWRWKFNKCTPVLTARRKNFQYEEMHESAARFTPSWGWTRNPITRSTSALEAQISPGSFDKADNS